MGHNGGEGVPLFAECGIADFFALVLKQETPARIPKTFTVRPSNQSPAKVTSRPPEPLRPVPARRPGTSLLAAKVRRRRHRLVPPAGR